MDIAIQNWVVNKYDELTQVRMLAEAGFRYVDWDLARYSKGSKSKNESHAEVESYHAALYNVMQECNMQVAHTHAPYPTYYTDSNKSEILIPLENAFLASKTLHAPYTVVHPMMPKHLEGEANRAARIALNVEFYNEIKPFAVKYGVKIVLENMFGHLKGVGIYNETACSRPQELMEIFNKINDSENFAICYDSGHGNMLLGKNQTEYIHHFGEHLKVLHLHDNNGKLDLHQPPYAKGTLDWFATFAALKETGYQGIYNYEIHPNAIGIFKFQHKKRLKELRITLEEHTKNLI